MQYGKMESSHCKIWNCQMNNNESSNMKKRNKLIGRKNLTGPQIRKLKDGFPRVKDATERLGQRNWRGKTLGTIAKEFSEQEERVITHRMVRYYYQQLKDNTENPPLPLGKGRGGQAAKRPVIVPAHASLRALTQAVWSLTGFSIPDIHRLYDVAAKKNTWKLPTIQHFRKVISELPIEAIRHTPSRNLMERHSLRLLPIQIVPRVGSRNIWVVLAAFELITGYIHLAIFKTKHGVEDLPSTTMADFLNETQDRLALPINRVEINGVSAEKIADLGSKLPDQQIAQGGGNLPADCPVPEELSTEGKFCDFLSEILAGYIENTVKPKLIEARKTIFDEYQLGKRVKRKPWSMKGVRPKYPETDKQSLTAYCEKNLDTVAAVGRVKVTSLKMLPLS